MSDENQPESTEGAAKGGKKLLVIALTIGLIAGAAAGSLVVGPLVAEGPKKESGHGEEAASGGGEDCAALLAAHGVQLAPAAVHTIDNVVVNPAQSGGTRFLMASVAFGLADAHSAEQMTLRDAEIRDIVVRVLSSRTVAQLTDLEGRNAIKEEMRGEVVALVGDHALVDIYFPQFVIQ